jgi:hypothetical protein
MRTIHTFDITNRKKRYYTILSNIFLLCSAGFYAFYRYMQYAISAKTSFWGSFVLPIGLFLLILARFIFMLRRKDIRFTQLHFTLLITLCWIFSEQYLFASISFFLGFFEYIVNRDTICIIDEDGVRIKSIPARKHAWDQLENVMIKNGIFTVDRKDNHIFQVDVSQEVLSFTEEQFNRFCAGHLK